MLDLRRYLNAAYWFLVEMTRQPTVSFQDTVDRIEKALTPRTEESDARDNAHAMQQLGMLMAGAKPVGA